LTLSPPGATLLPYTTLFRSGLRRALSAEPVLRDGAAPPHGPRPRGRRVHGARRVVAHVHESPRRLPASRDPVLRRGGQELSDGRDRKSTRLNSSHLGISYAV